MLSIVPISHPLLHQVTQPVKKVDEGVIKILQEMEQTLINQKDPPGVGLSANQVGLNLRLFLALINNRIIPFINPEIIDKASKLSPQEDSKSHLLEGCLSLRGYYGLVPRFEWVTLKAITVSPSPLQTPSPLRIRQLTEKGGSIPNNPNFFSEQTKKYTGLPAQIIQHEMDHLNGRTFVERLLEQNQRLYQITGKDKEGKTVFEEVELI
jgi:peptide deformylase